MGTYFITFLKKILFTVCIIFVLLNFKANTSYAQTDPVTATGGWQALVPTSGTPTARHEAAYVQAGDKFYLIGGRGSKPVQIYNPATKTWSNGAATPIELHHFQAVTLDGLIYVVGAFTGTESYPNEPPISNIYIYNPVKNTWTVGPQVPISRRRGAAGAVVYNNKIYIVSGITNGHNSGHVPWMDEYDPATNSWTILPDAPRARDHFHAAVVGGKLYAAAGRRTSASTGQIFTLTVAEVDVFDFATKQWSTLPTNIPTQRAGNAVGVLGDELIVIGGESAQATAHNEAEALNVTTNTWRSLASMIQGRHGTQAIVNNNGIYVAAGSGGQGGGPELSTQEAFYMFSPTTPTGTVLTASTLAGTPTSIAMGQVAVGSSKTETLTLSNTTGNQAIVVSSLTVGDNNFSINSTYTFPLIVAPGKSISIDVVFTPAAIGNKATTLQVQHSGTSGATSIALSGEGVTINNSNQSPVVLTPIGDQSATVGVAFSYSFGENTFSDGDGDVLSYTATLSDGSALPSWLSFTSGSRSFSGTPPVDASSLTVKITASDDKGGTVSDEFVISISGTVEPLYMINAGGPAVTINGKSWGADQYFSNGSTYSNNYISDIANTTLDDLYKSERNSSSQQFTYSFPVPSAGTYKVNLHFAEIYWGATTGGVGGVGQRVFGVNVEGGAVELANYDIFAEVGAMTAVVKTYDVFVSDGMLNIVFTASVDQPKVSAIEVILSQEIVNQSPVVLTPIGDQSATVGVAFSYSFGENTFSDGDGDVLSYTATLSDGSALPSWLSFTSGSRSFSGTPPVDASSLTVKITASDDKGGTVSDEFVISINAAPNQVPIADAGVNQMITLPTNSVILDGSASSDADGSITSYVWSKQSGPSATLSGALTATLTASDLVAGTYVFRLTVTDNDEATAFDEVAVTVNATPSGQAVVSFTLVNADTDKDIRPLIEGDVLNLATLPTRNLSIRANTNPVTVGSVVFILSGSQSRNQIETAAPYALFGDNSGNYNIWTPAGGAYTLTGTPYSASGGSGTKGTSLTINFDVTNNTTINQSPVVLTPIGDQSATVGVAFSYSFGENTFSDGDGDVLSYTATLSDGSALPSWLSFTSGSRSFSGTPPSNNPASLTVKVTAADGKGGTVSDEFVISINAAPNQVPIADAGVNQMITLPTNSVILDGSASSDADGSITSYVWSKQSGPSATLSGALTATLTASDLVAGTYVFRLTVTDNDEATAFDEVAVTVNATPSGQAVVSFTLVNADTDKDIRPLIEGDVLNLATLPTRNLSIRANTNPVTVGSVVFILNSNKNTENSAPYAYAGDANGDFKAWTPAVGAYTLVATPYTSSAGKGTQGVALSINFTVSNSIARTGADAYIYTDESNELHVYPNPFMEKVTLEFRPIKSGEVSLQIYNAQGSRITEIYTGQVKEGNLYSFEIAGDNFTSGVYIVQLITKEEVKNKKLFLIKL